MRVRLTSARISAIALACLVAAGCGETNVIELTGPSGVRCGTSLGAVPPTLPSGGAEVSVVVTAARECTWTAASSATWVQLSPRSGQGEGTLGITIAPNTQTESRTATITVNDYLLTLTQDARTPSAPSPPDDSSCVISIDPAERTFGYRGGEGTIRITARSDCVWWVASRHTWISITSAPFGAGNAVVRYAVAERRGRSARSGVVVVSGQTHEVTQHGRDDQNDGSDEDDD